MRPPFLFLAYFLLCPLMTKIQWIQRLRLSFIGMTGRITYPVPCSEKGDLQWVIRDGLMQKEGNYGCLEIFNTGTWSAPWQQKKEEINCRWLQWALQRPILVPQVTVVPMWALSFPEYEGMWKFWDHVWRTLADCEIIQTRCQNSQVKVLALLEVSREEGYLLPAA